MQDAANVLEELRLIEQKGRQAGYRWRGLKGLAEFVVSCKKSQDSYETKTDTRDSPVPLDKVCGPTVKHFRPKVLQSIENQDLNGECMQTKKKRLDLLENTSSCDDKENQPHIVFSLGKSESAFKRLTQLVIGANLHV